MLNNLHMIVAYDQNRAIGHEGDMPWGRALRSDLHNFKQLTTGNTVIMGRKTYESIGRPLPGRTTIVLSRNPETEIDGATVRSNLEVITDEDVQGTPFVVGGAQIYSIALPLVQTIVATEVRAEFPADTYVDDFGPSFRETARQHHAADEMNAYSFDIVEYTKHAE